MPVENLHPQYENKQYEMRQMRDTINGPSDVKRSGALYLPIPQAMYQAGVGQPATGILIDQNENKINSGSGVNLVSNAPWKHQIPAYSSYLQRARFPDITSLLMRGLLGISVKKDPEINLPKEIEYLNKNATLSGNSLIELFSFLVSEVLSVGRISLVLEVDKESNKVFINTYSAESFINWKSSIHKSPTGKSIETASLAVFQESSFEKGENDEFDHECDPCYVVLRDSAIDDNGEFIQAYSVQKYLDGEPGPVVIPTLRGKALSFVPLVTINSDSLGFDFGPLPLIGVSDIAISIYQKDADMSNSEFLTCNPMLVTTGVEDEIDENGCTVTGGTEFPIGSNVTLNLPDTQSQAYYVEPNSNCLNHMNQRIKDLKDEAVQYGASVLSQDKSGVESAESMRIRQSGNSSSLRSIIKNVGEGIERILQYAYMWETSSNKNSDEIEFKPNLELTEKNISSQEITALLQSYINGAISLDTFVLNLKNGGVEIADNDVDKEINKVTNASPNFLEGDDEDVETSKENEEEKEQV